MIDPDDPINEFIEPDTPQEGMDQDGYRYHLDMTSGMVWEATDDQDWYPQGVIPGDPNLLPPPPADAPSAVTVTSNPTTDVAIQPDGTVVASVVVAWTAPVLAIAHSYEVQISRDIDFTAPRSWVVAHSPLRITPVMPNQPYWARVRAHGDYSSEPPWSDVATFQPSGDPSAPEVPQGLVAIPGYKLIALSWSALTYADLGFYGVRWTVDLAGAPDVSHWVATTTKGTMLVVQGLDPALLYWFQVRAVNTSNMVRTSAVDPTLVDADQNPNTGWATIAQPLHPGKVGSADIAADTVVTNFLTTGVIDASAITTGTLTVGAAGKPPAFEVRNAQGALLARWDQYGLLMIDPTFPGIGGGGRALWLTAGEVRVTNAYDDSLGVAGSTWTASVTAEGINATSITYGVTPGGHNVIPNSGFELAAFTSPTAKVWTTAADWATAVAGASKINVDTSTVDLKLTTATY